MKKLIDRLLDIDLRYMAHKLGFVKDAPICLNQKEATVLLNHIEYLSRRFKEQNDLDTCLSICALLWEHRNPDWDNLSTFIKQILIRIGLTPSALMIDENRDSEHTLTSSGNVYLDLESTKYLRNNRIIVNGHIVLLTEAQKKIWDAVDSYNRIGISAPTSAGKSFILCLLLINYMAKNDVNAFYIVPNISLINQVSSDLNKIIKTFDFKKQIQVHQTFHQVTNNSNIFVLTQERAFSSLLQTDNNIPSLDFLIVDEIQNIERVTYEDNERADDLLTVLTIINDSIKPTKVLISGPRIEKVDQLVKNLFGREAFPIDVKLPPVVNMTYSFKGEGNNFFLYQHSQLSEQPRRLRLNSHPILTQKLFGKSRLNNDSTAMLCHVATQLQEDSMLLFTSTKPQSRKIAQSIKALSVENPAELSSLEEYISSTVHEKYGLVDCIKNGVAYHNAGVPPNVRNVVEIAFKKRLLRLITTTTTLLQGINLPAKYLIARNHKLDSQKEGTTLSSYEFANLRGRAGRLMTDFIGRAIIVDYKAFEDSQVSLFEYPTKEVSATYERRFQEYKDDILAALATSKEVCEEYRPFNDLLVFLRNRIYRYGNDARFYLEKHNISIPKDLAQDVENSLSSLTVPKQLCISNPHWDVLILQKLFDNASKFINLPKSAFTNELYHSLDHNIRILYKLTPYYYNKYLGIDINNNGWELDKILKLAMDWIQEKPLSEILSSRMKPISAEKIEDHIEWINQSVCYDIPKLLKPVLFMQADENPILSFLEFGAYSADTRNLIELGVTREDALEIKKQFGHNFSQLNNSEIKRQLTKDLPKMNEWIRSQIELIL